MTPAGDKDAPSPRGEPDTLSTALSASSFRRRLNAKVLADVAVAPIWVAAASFAIWRLAVGQGSLVVGVLAIALGAAGILRRFVKEAWSEPQSAVLLDRAAGAGGLLLSLRELPAGEQSRDWLSTVSSRVQRARPPEVQVGRPLLASAAAILFALVAALLPAAKAPFSRLQAAAAARVEEAEAKAEILAAEEKVPDAIAQELERLKAEAESGKFDAADWEAADAVQQALEHAAAERQGELASAEAAAQQLAAALDSNAASESEARAREDLEQALMDLEDGASAQSGGEQQGQGDGQEAKGEEGEKKPGDKSAEKGKEGEQGKDGEKAGDAKDGDPSQDGKGKEKPGDKGKSSKDGKPSKSSKGVKSPADAKSLAKALEQRRQALEKGFPQSKSQQASNGKGKSRGDPSNYPKGGKGKAEGDGKGTEKGEEGDGDGPGGGPGPGGGAAPLTFGAEVPMQTERLDLEALPESDDPEPGELLGLKAKNPRKDGAAVTTPGASSAAGPDGVAPHGGTVAPRHRELLKKYFDHQKGNPQ